MTATVPLRVRFVGRDDASAHGALLQACRAAARGLPDVRVVASGPADVVVVTEGSTCDIISPHLVFYPFDRAVAATMWPAWAASDWHRRYLPAGADLLPLPALGDAEASGGWDWSAWADAFRQALMRLVGPRRRARLAVAVVAGHDPQALRLTVDSVRSAVQCLVVVHPAGAGAVADVAAQLGAATIALADTSPHTVKQAVVAAADSEWVLLLHAGECVVDGQAMLRQASWVHADGPDLGLVEMHDSAAGRNGSYLAPRLLAGNAAWTWAPAGRERVDVPVGAGILMLPVQISGVAALPRPELRAAVSGLGPALLRDALAAYPGSPLTHHDLAQLHLRAEEQRPAARHLDATVHFAAKGSRWPGFAIQALEARVEIALALGHVDAAALRLAEVGHQGYDRPRYWLLSALTECRQGRHDAAVTSVATGWDRLGDGPDPQNLRPRLARLAAELCVRSQRLPAAAAWLVELVKSDVVPPAEVAGWCRWLAEVGRPDDAALLAVEAKLDDWQQASPSPPTLSDVPAQAWVTAIVYADAGTDLHPHCLTAAGLLADDLIIVAPAGHAALAAASGHAATAMATDGDLATAITAAAQRAADGWVLLLRADEWSDPIGVASLRRTLAGPDLPQGLTLDVYPAIEGQGPDVGESAVLRLARRESITGCDPLEAVWHLGPDASLGAVAGPQLWRSAASARRGRLPLALTRASDVLHAGDLREAASLIEAWLEDGQASDWPPPALWRGWEMLADVLRLQGCWDAADEAERRMIPCRPCRFRPAADEPDPVLLAANPPQWVHDAVQAVVRGEMRSAVALVDAVAGPTPAAVWGLMARVYLEAARLDEAEAALRRCLLMRAGQPQAPSWFPGLATVPDGLLARCFLAAGEPRQALDWLLPVLTRVPGEVEFVVLALAAAWLCQDRHAMVRLVSLLTMVTPPEEMAALNETMAAAADEFGWPSASLAGWQAWLGMEADSTRAGVSGEC
jgi:hypothetical protein